MNPFEVVCTKCIYTSQKENKLYAGLVNHHYEVKTPWIILITYHCFTCNTNWHLEVNGLNEKQQKPKDKETFKKQNNIKEPVIN